MKAIDKLFKDIAREAKKHKNIPIIAVGSKKFKEDYKRLLTPDNSMECANPDCPKFKKFISLYCSPKCYNKCQPDKKECSHPLDKREEETGLCGWCGKLVEPTPDNSKCSCPCHTGGAKNIHSKVCLENPNCYNTTLKQTDWHERYKDKWLSMDGETLEADPKKLEDWIENELQKAREETTLLKEVSFTPKEALMWSNYISEALASYKKRIIKEIEKEIKSCEVKSIACDECYGIKRALSIIKK